MLKQRRNFSGAEKMAILRERLIEKTSISEVCEKHGLQPMAFYQWQKKLFEERPEEAEALIATVRLSNVVEFKRWIKSFGALAEVLRPDWLRSELYEELLSSARLYDDRISERIASTPGL